MAGPVAAVANRARRFRPKTQMDQPTYIVIAPKYLGLSGSIGSVSVYTGGHSNGLSAPQYHCWERMVPGRLTITVAPALPSGGDARALSAYFHELISRYHIGPAGSMK